MVYRLDDEIIVLHDAAHCAGLPGRANNSDRLFGCSMTAWRMPSAGAGAASTSGDKRRAKPDRPY
jgi:hypothetical protein